MEKVQQWKARAVVGGKDPKQLVIARRTGESVLISLNGEILEVTVVAVANNSCAILFETAEKNLILRKELIDPC